MSIQELNTTAHDLMSVRAMIEERLQRPDLRRFAQFWPKF